MSRFGDFLRRASTTLLLHGMVEANRRVDADLASADPLDGDCVCGLPLRSHRLPSGYQITCRETQRLRAVHIVRHPDQGLQTRAKVIPMVGYRREFLDRLSEGFCEIDSADVSEEV